jgi:hypothetical protein
MFSHPGGHLPRWLYDGKVGMGPLDRDTARWDFKTMCFGLTIAKPMEKYASFATPELSQ